MNVKCEHCGKVFPYNDEWNVGDYGYVCCPHCGCYVLLDDAEANDD